LSELEDVLELAIVTYNRASLLERTLGQVLDGPFARCRLTVLDNASTDATPEVCRAYEQRFEHMRTVRHRVNVGLGPNYLRAVELAELPYMWILGDDDTFDFADCGDVIEALTSERFDLVSLGAPHQQAWERGLATSTRELVERGARFFTAYTFLPSMIFRTRLFDSESVARGYRSGFYPHFPFLVRAVERDYSVYGSRREIVVRNPDDANTGLRWLVGWVGACATIADRRLRRRAVYEPRRSRLEWVATLASMIAYERRLYPDRVAAELRGLMRALPLEQTLLAAPLLPLAAVPARGYELLKRAWRAATGRAAEDERLGPMDELRM
jgi:glycosyltransferase involved in cell wall biosynthesis